MSYSTPLNEPIAIVGSSCRFPGNASSPSKLWDLLLSPKDISRRPPADRFNLDGFYHADTEHHGTTNIEGSYFLNEDIRLFDAAFFNITPKEAEAIDPQQRLLLESVYEAMESAGFTIQDLQGSSTSVYAGLMIRDYMDVQARDPDYFSKYMVTGTSSALTSNRISYFFDWTGPSMTVDTACSSSLVALHQAVLGLRSGESRVSCVCGSNLLLGPELFISAANLHMLSSRSRMWDKNAEGYARGDGFATVLLKRLSHAIQDGDNIEAIIRETGVNSDGRTKGITMPSSDAQATLIRETYQKSGLDPARDADRCQYFEAHGTGTQAGDPQEAGAIHKAFFEGSVVRSNAQKMVVGSIKTVVGHTEGCAGLAGVLKASLALRHGLIPPNLHYYSPNPNVVPFLDALDVPVSILPWPAPAAGSPRRASVNSFGFGGTNAHVILESYEPAIHNVKPWVQDSPNDQVSFGHNSTPFPFVFSANSERALIAMIDQYVQFLDTNESVDLRDLSWTLLTKRTILPVRASFVALTAPELSEKMKSELSRKESSGADLGVRASGETNSDPVILGVFTGQGAQWATMGRDLIIGSAQFSATIERLEKSLGSLPDPPAWSLKAELMAPPSQSRLSEAALSQPLCTAIQIALVDVLRSAGITFRATVGHSSGEIGAAYSAGVVTAEEGVRIAYYRGVHAHLARASSGARGSMLAVGMGLEDAQTLTDLPQFEGRISVAASNSPASVTLSGDESAIEEAREMLVAQKKFARALQVDTAYHSHHMIPCAEPYISSLKACNISPKAEDPSCSWISSVYGSKGTPTQQELTAQYWSNNMTQKVLFSQALERAVIEAGPFDAVMEIGPHPALKGPATQTLKESGENAPYTGVLDRKSNDLVALNSALAFLWCRLGAFIDFRGYEEAHAGTNLPRPILLKDLPTYPWEHGQPYWSESRLSREYRTRSSRPHELLGHMSPGSPEHELKWRNILRREEVPWLTDHKIQGQVLLPAGAFCAMMLDAGLTMVADRTVSLLELLDVQLHSPISIPEASRGVELVTSIKQLDPHHGESAESRSVLEATFSLSTGAPDGSTPLKLAVTSRVRITFGAATADALPRKPHNDDVVHLKSVDINHFYSAMRDIGLSYDHAFSALHKAERGWDYASAIMPTPSTDDRSVLSVKPSWIESCLQVGYLAFAYPGDGNLWTTFLPQSIGRLAFTPAFQKSEEYSGDTVLEITSRIMATKYATGKQLPSFTADIEVCDPGTGYTWMQVENVVFSSLNHAVEKDDRELFFSTVWGSDAFDNHSAEKFHESPSAARVHQLLDRTALFYLRDLKARGILKAVPGPYQPLANFVGRLCNSQTAVSLDTKASHREIAENMGQSPRVVDLRFMKVLGESLQARILPAGDLKDTALSPSTLLETVPALKAVNKHLGSITQKLRHRFAQMQVLEIGSSYLGPSGGVLAALGDSSSTYVFGNIGPAFSAEEGTDHRVQDVLLHSLQQDQLDKLKESSQEGFDLVVVSFLLHGRENMDSVISNLRQLIKPGGSVLFVEPTKELTWLRYLLYGQLNPTLTAHDGQDLGSPVPLIELDKVLRRSMFSGVDHVSDYSGVSVIISKALDDRVSALLHPLQPDHLAKLTGKLLLVGDGNLSTYRTIQDTVRLLHGWQGSIVVEQSLDTLGELEPKYARNFSAAVILNDLNIHPSSGSQSRDKRQQKIRDVFNWTNNILWVTLEGDFNDPIQAATVALSRSIASQIPGVRFQSLLVDNTWNVEYKIAANLVRLVYSQLWKLSRATHMWTDEDEIKINGRQTLIPRVLPARELNDRLNASRRVITEGTSSPNKDVTIDILGSIDSLVCYARANSHALNIDDHSNTKVTVRASYSSLLALRVAPHDYLHICIGRVPGQEGTVLAFSETLSNSVMVDRLWQLPCGVDEADEHRVVELATQYVAATLINSMFEAGIAVLYEPSNLLASILSKLVHGTDKQLVFLTSNNDQISGTGVDWTFIHPHSSRSTIQSLVPRDTNLFINLGPAESYTAQRVISIVPPGRSVEKDALFRIKSRVASDQQASSFIEKLRLTRDFALESKTQLSWETSSIIDASKLIGRLPEVTEPFTVVDWAGTDKISLQARPLEGDTLLSHDKIYLLANVGIVFAEPLARWLASGGARHVVIAESARSHALEISPPAWVAVLRKSGVRIDFEEVNFRSQVEVSRLRQKFLGIVGLVYGGNLGVEETSLDFSQTIFEGAANLDESFGSQHLDFFVMLTPSYAKPEEAGEYEITAFMEALAAQRRNRGLNGSSVSVPEIWGNASLANAPAQEIFFSIAESDICGLLNEAIVWGGDSAQHSPHLVTALKRLAPSSSSEVPTWRLNPKFSHLVSRSNHSTTSTSRELGQSLKQELELSKSLEEASKTLQHYFVDHLKAMLSLGPDSVRDDTDLVGIGIDSLMASDLRSWFLNELEVDVPVLKILGGSTVKELCEELAAGFQLNSLSDETPVPVEDDVRQAESSSAVIPTPASSPSSSGSWIPLSEGEAEALEDPYIEGSLEFVQIGVDQPRTQPPSLLSRKDTMSYSQTRLWFPTTYLEQETPFNCTTSYRITGPLDLLRLEKALKQVTQRHEIFRTAFHNDTTSGEPIQSVFPDSHFELQTLSGNETEEVAREFRRIANHVFDLETGDSFIASIISHTPQEHTIVFGYHHIIMDGVSWQLTLNEMASLYKDLGARLPSPTQYLEFTARQRRLVETGAHDSKLAFWKKEFPDPVEPIPLFPFAKVGTRKTLTRYTTLDIVEHIDAKLVSDIHKASLGAKTTSFHFYLSALQVMLSKFLDIDDLCIGVIDANRSEQAFLNTIGFLLDLLPLRLPLNRKERFTTTLSNTRKRAHAALSHSGVPLESIIRELNVSTSPTHTPLFQVLINYRMGALRSPQLGDSSMTFLDYEDARAPFDLTLSIDEKDDGTGMLTFSMQDYMYDREGADLIVKTYLHFLRVLSQDISLRLSEIQPFDRSLVEQGIDVGTGSVIDFKWPATQTVVHQIDQWTRTQPEAVAVKDLYGEMLTYRQMQKRINILAHAITHAGAKAGSSVAVFSEPTVDSICCILAILRVGAAYTPLDVRNSSERLAAVIEECKPRVILFHSSAESRLKEFNTQASRLLNIQLQAQASEDIFPNLSTPTAPALVLYTSGSTGRPKGITVTNYNLSIQCTSVGERLGLKRDVILQQSALGFDASVAQIFYALVFGGTIIMGDNRGDPMELASLIEREKVTVTLIMVSEMSSLLDHASSILSRCHGWRIAMCGGEAFTSSLVRQFQKLNLSSLAVFNAYGPTEGTIISSISDVPYRTVELSENYTIPVGPPVPNYGVYVLDEKSQPVPLGWPGELCIAGPGVTPGYVGQPELTAAKFVQDTVSRPRGLYQGWDRIYRTGDRARLLHDGSFLFLGRIDGDSQVKLRGIRIELDEVANSVLRTSDGVLSSAVVRVRGDTNQILVAYVIFSEQKGAAYISKPQAYLRQLLQSLPLPVYMRPAVAVPVDAMPVTERGKLDTKALAAIPLSQFHEEAASEQPILNANELKMKLVWEDVLSELGAGLHINKDSDFFSVGGNSLLLMRLKAKIQEVFSVSIPLVELFQATTLGALASRIGNESPTKVNGSIEAQSGIDWDAETALPTTLTSQEVLSRWLNPTKQVGRPFSVVFTGSTGFLGREILSRLVAHPSVAYIHCIAVRPGRTHKIASSKIISYEGDLYKPQFGLDNATARAIFSTATAIIHNGAEVSHMKSYHSLRTPNVLSTKELVRLSVEYGIGTIPRFHYVSSAGVGHLVPAPSPQRGVEAVDAFPPISLATHPPPRDGSDGYVAAKWASERSLERAAAAIPGFAAVVHRPSNITGAGVGENDIVHSLLRFSAALNAVPQMTAATGAFDFISLETCAADIVRGVLGDSPAAGTVRYEHRTGETVVPVGQLGSFLAAKCNVRELQVLSWPEWVDRALAIGLDQLVGEFLRELDGRMRMPLLTHTP
ncbi:hypothetical protein TruAng_006085 [Truncatella angustata]|nr:hypothetical protein TruAng_006085 [Truncatella angustata]